MKFKELINRNSFLKDRFRILKIILKRLRLMAFQITVKKLKKILSFLHFLEIKLMEIYILKKLGKMEQYL